MLFLSVCKGSDYFSNHQIKSHLFLNKMHFYYFLPSFVNGFHRFHGFFCLYHLMNRMNLMAGAMQCLVKSGASGDYLFSVSSVVFNRRQRRRTRKLYMIVTVVISYFCVFLRLLWLILVAHPGARTWCHALPWWALCCWLSSRTAAASKQKIL